MVKEISFGLFPHLRELASYSLGFGEGRFCPAVYEQKRWGDTLIHRGFSIRILTGRRENYRSGTTSTSWEYFETDPTGLITSSPRGMAKEYNKKVRIIDMPAFVEAFKERHVNE